MFRSTTLKLTGWYLIVLIILSVTFSIFIYQVTTNEVQISLERFQTNLQKESDYHNIIHPTTAITLRNEEQGIASSNLSNELLYINIFVLIFGGFFSYFLARRSLYPIEKAHEAQSRFTSDASHELRTPLTIMKMELEVALSDENATINDLKKVLTSNLEEVDKLSNLSEMLLNLSRLENDKIKLGSVSINKITSNVIEDFKRLSRKIDFESKKIILYVEMKLL